MTAYVSNQAGNWSTTTIWTPNGTPGDGDTVSIGHNVTVDSARTIGTSGVEGTAAISFTDAVTLAINANLTVRGDLVYTYDAAIVQAAGTIVTFDSSAASSPSTTHYRIYVNPFFGDGSWTSNGTLDSPATIQSHSGGANAFFYDSVVGSVRINIDWTYTKVLRLGDVDNNVGSFNVDGRLFKLLRCVFDACGCLDIGADSSSTVIDIQRSAFKNGVNASNGGIDISMSVYQAPATGVFNNNWFGFGIYATYAAGCTLNKNVLSTGFKVGANSKAAAVEDNLFIVGQTATPGTMVRTYYLFPDTGDNNPHGPTLSESFANDMVDCVFESLYPTLGAGDMIGMPFGPAGSFTYNISGCILIPSGDGKSPAKFISDLSTNADATITLTHNTIVADGVGGEECGLGQYGETGGGVAGRVSACKSNLVWSANSGKALIINRAAGTLQDWVAAANSDYNALWNGGSTSPNALGYGSGSAGNLYSSGTPDTHQVVLAADPFVDKTRRFRTWGASIGGAGTDADTLTLLRLNVDWSDGGYNPSNGATPDALIAWVRDGFKVKATSLKNAGHDGVTIGAMEWVESPFEGPWPASGKLPPRSRRARYAGSDLDVREWV